MLVPSCEIGDVVPWTGRPARTMSAAVGRADALVAEADAENRRRRSEAADEIGRDPGLGRRARSRRNDDVRRRERLDLVERDRVVAADDRVAAQLADVPRQVVDERVVVIDEENHSGVRQRIDHAAGLVERLAVLLLGIRVGDDPAAGTEIYPTGGATAVRMAMLLSSAPVTLQ